MFALRKNNFFFLLVIIILISTFLRFYNINWGAPFYFHPDERNIASSVSQLKFPEHLNPHFFAYGSLPIYTIYFTGILINFFSQFSTPILSGSNIVVSFDHAILIGRFFSALFSLILIPLIFFVGKNLKDVRTGFVAASFALVSAGFIQFAHFGTFEMWLTLLSVLLFLSTLKLLRKPDLRNLFLTSVIFGLSVATKVSQLVLLPLPILALAFPLVIKKEKLSNRLFIFIRKSLLFCLLSLIIFFITNPFVLLDYSSFIGSMKYESGVALGTINVFYTGEFVNTVPLIFQFLHVYPFLINPLLTILFIPSFFYILFVSIKTKNYTYLLLYTFYLILFLSQAFLYAKWTRYMMPTLPFIYLICALALVNLSKINSKKYLPFSIRHFLFAILIGANFLFGISYFITAFVMPDTREAAAAWAKSRILQNAPILSEVYDLGITPFNDSFRNITLFNFYDLDNNSPQYTFGSLSQQLSASDYIILPSQRILKVRLQDAKDYPVGRLFYSSLFSQTNGFKKIYETPCGLFCKITYMGSPVYSFEETANVFDRPTVFIFEKNKN